MASRLTSPESKPLPTKEKDLWLRNHLLLYVGKRMAVIDNRNRSLAEEDYDLIVWDKALGCTVAWGDFNEDGSLSVSAAYGPHEMEIDGNSPKELAMNATKTINWILKH
jgi:hypothetical protein